MAVNSVDMAGLTMAFNSSALTATGAETVHDSTVAMNFCINGKVYQKSGTNADQTTPTADYNSGAAWTALPINKGTVFVWAYTSGGVVKAMQGEVVDLDSTGAFVTAPEFPGIPNDVCPFAYQLIKNGSTGSNWTFGTSNWNATGITSTIVNICTLPGRPQIS